MLFVIYLSSIVFTGTQPSQQSAYLPNGGPLLNTQSNNSFTFYSNTFRYFNVQNLILDEFSGTDIGKCAGDTVYALKDWCEINNQQQQQQFHHQALHQKGGWNNFGPIADWTSIDPAIVTSSRPLPFQTTSTWQFPHIHPSHPVTHNAQQVQYKLTIISRKCVIITQLTFRSKLHLLSIGRCNHLLALPHPRPQGNWVLHSRAQPHSHTPNSSPQDLKSKVSWSRSSSVQTEKCLIMRGIEIY